MSEPAPQKTPQTITVTLEEPIQRESGPVTSITLRKPKAGEMRGLKVGELINGEVTAVLALIPRISSPFIAEEEANNLSSEDIAEIAGTVTGFFMTQAQKTLVAKMLGASE
jgi:Phage tail protein E.